MKDEDYEKILNEMTIVLAQDLIKHALFGAPPIYIEQETLIYQNDPSKTQYIELSDDMFKIWSPIDIPRHDSEPLDIPVFLGIDYGCSPSKTAAMMIQDGKATPIDYDMPSAEYPHLTFECDHCKAEFDIFTISFGKLYNAALKAGWKITWKDIGYDTRCIECG